MLPSMLSCKQAQELFYDHLDKELSVEEAALVQGHLDACADCCGGFETAQEFIDCIKESRQPSSNFADAVKTWELINQSYESSVI